MQRPERQQDGGETCIPNIAEGGRRRRLRGGLVWLVAGMALTVAAIRFSAPPAAFVGLYAVFFMAALGFFQAREKT